MRGKQAPKRNLLPDSRYNNITVSKFINYVMKNGKKTVAEKIVYDCFDEIEKNTKMKGLDVFEQAIKNVSPQVEVRSRRIGGGNYQIPVEVRSLRRESLAFRWILTAAKSKKGKKMSSKLADELVEAYNNRGDAIKKKDDVYKMAQANRAFAHFIK
ncbi:MAG TPA: 30S ribosomal protein S7 [bacterium]|nr:30S ribosomal protein S7 [Patescibacteria group bacterium]HOC96202.1 30S ribosomal protein S7 [bacterium]HPO11469.1 30S ribosomal protein S7 [bacterium]